MKKGYYFAILLLTVALTAIGQVRKNAERLQIIPVHHASFVLQADNKTVYVDPAEKASYFEELTAPDLILITDIHSDHMDAKVIEAIDKKQAIIVCPQAVADKLPNTWKAKMVVLKNGEKTTQHGIAIEAMPMYNLPEEADSRHPKGRGNGYVLTMGGKRVYISGDTEDITEMRELKNIDVAFVCMNLPYTMDINQAASAVLAFKPGIVYPYHHKGQDINVFKKLVNDKNKRIEVRVRQWYPGQ